MSLLLRTTLINSSNCTLLDQDDTGDVILYQYFCFLIERTFGIISLIILFLPGLLFSFKLILGFWKEPQNIWILKMLSPCFCVIFPIIFFIVKVTMNLSKFLLGIVKINLEIAKSALRDYQSCHWGFSRFLLWLVKIIVRDFWRSQ